MKNIEELNSGITRTGIEDSFRYCCESTEGSTPSFRTYKNAKSWTCQYCGSIIKSRRLFRLHYKSCEERQKRPLDSKGRVIGQYDRSDVAKKAVAAKVARGEKLGKPHSDEMRKHLSDVRIKYLESHNNYGLQWFEIGGVKVQGTWEKRFAEFLLAKNIKFSRKRLSFCKTHTYTPDFYCEDQDVYFEVKGFRRDRDIYKMYLVLDEHPELHIKMIEHSELKNLENIDIFSLPDFQEKYKRENIDMSKFNDVWQN